MKTKNKIKLFSLILSLLILSVVAKGQLTWNVQMIDSGKFEVNVTPTKSIEEVNITVNLTSSSGTVEKKLTFTNAKVPTLKTNKTYARYYTCDTDFKKAEGKYISFYIAGGGGKADGTTQRIMKKLQNSKKTVEPGKKIFFE